MLVVVGGGESGRYHARGLRRAVARGQVAGPLLIVDREPPVATVEAFAGDPITQLVRDDWSSFLAGWLPRAAPDDYLVPAPYQPHLLWTWLAQCLGVGPVPAPAAWGLPFEVEGGDGARYLSAAAWRCPATCVEPAHCPILHAPRDWDLGDLLTEGARRRGYQPAVFRCLHLAQGIGAIAVSEIQEAASRCAEGDQPILVATTSRCHAAIGALAGNVLSDRRSRPRDLAAGGT